ncbi:hypothetical protein Psch_03787 [Pelotomaculum schinkii]|uniref:Uncharacterized protein n=1 Tax=Pelotomaculum schinkii TaxID=78350 RepID=A0A4Y7R7S8_9FIRM|nr:hypothetical protein Psch_03787 [Pelotomaculum schinkii]
MDYYTKCRGPLFHPGGFELTRYAVEYCQFPSGAHLADIGGLCLACKDCRYPDCGFGKGVVI